MISSPAARPFRVGSAQVAIFGRRETGGQAAARQAAQLIRAAIDRRGVARIIVATGNSQIAFIEALVSQGGVDWSRVEAFHMDEYVGIAPDHPASFRHWIKTRFADRCRPKSVHYIAGDAGDLGAEIGRYTNLLNAAPVDLAFVGFGENGHIAFNDPPVADFADPATLKVVTLDEACRRQQVGEGHFKTIATVPTQAVTLTCPGLFRAEAWICCVPEGRKATAVRDALEGPITTECPASLVRRHAHAHVYLDTESAGGLDPATVKGARPGGGK
ncbi:MAG: Glucosamine-6-phosphate deaminase [Verrucomicrobia bacterium]|nr:Glucosamine-6-phosphate deaminase [Verrucomicrobiota bacterium]